MSGEDPSLSTSTFVGICSTDIVLEQTLESRCRQIGGISKASIPPRLPQSARGPSIAVPPAHVLSVSRQWTISRSVSSIAFA